jgi:hypothetical protein
MLGALGDFIIITMKQFSKSFRLTILIVAGVTILSACQAEFPAQELIATEPDIPHDPPLSTAEPTLTFTPEPTSTPTATPIVVLDPEPIKVEFEVVFNVHLKGLYYPASENPAPLIVLVPWARGDAQDWHEIALWLQNRGQLERTPDYNQSWRSSDWFPDNTYQGPLGVFVVTLRDCLGGCSGYLPIEWLQDMEAVMRQATRLQGVDHHRILTAGASIGADGAIYGCAYLNGTDLGSCLGSFSLSPGSLLTIPYDDMVGELMDQEPPLPVYCLFGLRDDASVETCTDIPGLNAVDYGYIEDHGLELVQPGLDPDPLFLFEEFIETALEVQ